MDKEVKKCPHGTKPGDEAALNFYDGPKRNNSVTFCLTCVMELLEEHLEKLSVTPDPKEK